jgi:outer membrane protein OmpA-like peptidoglycan-associated protein
MLTSEQIIEIFANSARAGTERGLCIGTADSCKEKTSTPAAPTSVDMLVNFDLNSADLTPDTKAKLVQFAKALRDNRLSAQKFAIEGYTDASGSSTYNKELSQRRAQSVMAFLVANGIDASRLNAVGFGKTHPRAANPYDPSNRRVEMRIRIDQ